MQVVREPLEKDVSRESAIRELLADAGFSCKRIYRVWGPDEIEDDPCETAIFVTDDEVPMTAKIRVSGECLVEPGW